MREEKFNCKKCRKIIFGHNQYLHDGMCDNCYFDEYFPEGAQVVETDIERIRIHCKSKPIKKENQAFKELLQSTDFEQEKLVKIIKEIQDKVKCANGECCGILKHGLRKENLDQFFANAEICPIIFNVLENAKEEFLEDLYAFENPDI